MQYARFTVILEKGLSPWMVQFLEYSTTSIIFFSDKYFFELAINHGIQVFSLRVLHRFLFLFRAETLRKLFVYTNFQTRKLGELFVFYAV